MENTEIHTNILVEVKRVVNVEYPQQITLQEISKDFQKNHKTMIVAAMVDGVVKDLQTTLEKSVKIEFIDMESDAGLKVYQRSVVFIMIIAIKKLYPKAKLIVESSLGNGLYCRLLLDRALLETDAIAIEEEMRKIVEENRPIVKKSLPRAEVVELFIKNEQFEKVKLIQSLKREFVSIYYCGDFYEYLYGAKVTTTGVLKQFAVTLYHNGLVLRIPSIEQPFQISPFKEQPKLTQIFQESNQWAEILKCDYVAMLNEHNHNGKIGEIIRLSEALHEKKFAQIADHIALHRDKLRVILIAGPSSSGKTTFAQRLGIQLKVNGIKPVTISIDDYFVDRKYTPRNLKGEYDFEALEAVDVKLFNQHLVDLLAGKEVEMPTYNFITGQREYKGVKIRLEERQPMIIEGIHGLNEALTCEIPRESKYKIYISALTQLAIDEHNRIPTTDARLLRRMVRDSKTRGSNALKTLRQWPSVRAGEEKNIFPYQEEADVMFNSALIYELGVVKKYAEPLLQLVSPDVPEYAEAVRLLEFLAYFDDVQVEDEIANNSILREFIGGSCFFE